MLHGTSHIKMNSICFSIRWYQFSEVTCLTTQRKDFIVYTWLRLLDFRLIYIVTFLKEFSAIINFFRMVIFILPTCFILHVIVSYRHHYMHLCPIDKYYKYL